MSIYINILSFWVFQLFVIGFFGVLSSRSNILFIFMAIEIILLASSLNFVLYAILFNSFVGQLAALFILVSSAAEAAIGLSLIIAFYKVRGSVSYMFLNLIKS